MPGWKFESAKHILIQSGYSFSRGTVLPLSLASASLAKTTKAQDLASKSTDCKFNLLFRPNSSYRLKWNHTLFSLLKLSTSLSTTVVDSFSLLQMTPVALFDVALESIPRKSFALRQLENSYPLSRCWSVSDAIPSIVLYGVSNSLTYTGTYHHISYVYTRYTMYLK